MKNNYDYDSGSFTPYIIVKEIEGVNFKFLIGDTDGKQWYQTCATDPDWPEMRFIKESMITNGDVFFECGSHHGCTTILISNWVGVKGKVLAFEPNILNFNILKTNLGINFIKNVEALNVAVGNNTGDILIDISSSNSSVVVNEVYGDKYKTVHCVTLDSYIDMKPDFLKIDVEGFEKDVILGAKNILTYKPKLAIELHTEKLIEYNTSVKDIFNLLNRDHYNFWIQWEDNQMPIPYDFDRQIEKRVHVFALPKPEERL